MKEVRYRVYLNGRDVDVDIVGDDSRMDCGCLMNSDMVLMRARDAVDDLGLFPEGHVWYTRYGNKCPSGKDQSAYGTDEVRIIGNGVGFVWLETIKDFD